MEPTLKTIADLFAVPIVAEPVDGDEGERPKVGSNATESAELGRESLAQGDVVKAIEHFRRVFEQQEADTAESHQDLAAALDYSDQFPQAMRQYIQALRIQDDADPHVGLSDIYKRHGRFRDAIEELRKAADLAPEDLHPRLKLAETFREMGERKQALAAIQQAVLVNPENPFVHYWMGDLLIEMKRYDAALDALRAAIELSPGDDFLYTRACVAFWGAGRQQDAVKAIRLASDLDPSKHLYHGLLGILLDEMGLKDEANQESARAQKMDRYDHDLVGRLLDEMGIEP